MIRSLLSLASVLTLLGTMTPLFGAEMIDGYEVLDDEAARITDPDQKLARNVSLGPVEFGGYDADKLTLYVFVTLLDASPIKGKVHKIAFRHVSINEIPFKIEGVESAFDIPEEPPYEIDTPLTVTANWAEAVEGGLGELMNPSTNINMSGQMLVFGKFKGPKKKKKYVVPVDVQIQIARTDIADRLEGLIREYTLEQAGPQLEALGIDPADVDMDLIMELLKSYKEGETIETPEEGSTPETGAPKAEEGDAKPAADDSKKD